MRTVVIVIVSNTYLALFVIYEQKPSNGNNLFNTKLVVSLSFWFLSITNVLH